MPRPCNAGVKQDMQLKEDSKIDKNNRNACNASVLFQNARCRRNVQVEKRNQVRPPGKKKAK